MKEFYNKKVILITGHTGFKGSWLALTLSIFGNEVYGLSDNIRKSGIYKVIRKHNIFKKEFIGDIVNENFVNSSLRNLKIDVVFHLAAQGLVSEASANPKKTLSTNILGTYNILNICNKNKSIKLMVIATTDKVYQNHNNKNTEESKLGGKEFYSASKAGSEHVIEAFINTKKRASLNIGVVRAGNVLGGGDYAKDRVLTDIVYSLKQQKNIHLRNPESIRPWQYILDSINGYLMVGYYCALNKTDEIFNLNSKINNKNNVRNLTEIFIKHWGHSNVKIIYRKNKNFYESAVLTINSNKANNLLGWYPKFDLDQICNYTVGYETSKNKYKYSINHINEFFYNY